MLRKRLIIAGTALFGICLGYVLMSFVKNSQNFIIKDYLGILIVGLGSLLFVIGHYFSKSKAPL